MSRLMLRSVPLALALAAMTACGDDTPTTPTTPTPETVTETFSGTVNPNGAATHTFTTATAGPVQVTLTAIGPDSSVISGLALGEWNGTGCQERIANDAAVQTTVILGNVSQAGQLCVRVRDVGRFTGTTTYEITVVHP
jgi:hypothetical protein